MRKLILILAACMLLCALFPAYASTENSCGANASWSLDNGTLLIAGSGPMADYSPDTAAPWYGQKDAIHTVIISEGITSIGSHAFSHCENLTSAALPETLQAIGSCAFWGCTALRSISLPDSLSQLSFGAFFKCSALTEVSIPSGITALEPSVFAQCERLETVVLHDNITSIGEDAFSRCYSLQHIALPLSLQSIGRHAFFGCAQLSQLTFPEQLRQIDEASFYGCINLTTLRFMGTVPQLAERAFLGLDSVIYYSVNDPSWVQITDNDFGGQITWQAECFHEYEMTFTPPNCTEDGFSTYTCLLCQHTYQDMFLPAAGHHYQNGICTQCGSQDPLFFLIGDVDNDGEVSDWDSILLLRYLAGWNVDLHLAAADCDGDGEITDWDAILLARYMAQWPVTLG